MWMEGAEGSTLWRATVGNGMGDVGSCADNLVAKLANEGSMSHNNNLTISHTHSSEHVS